MKLTTHLHRVPRLRSSGAIPVFLLTPFVTCEGGRQPLPSLIKIYTRRAVEKVRAGIELWRQEVAKGDGEEESCVVNWINKGMNGKKVMKE